MIDTSSDDLHRIASMWMERISGAEKRESVWRTDAEAAEFAYLAGQDQEARGAAVPDLNILHSNVETIVPAIYNSTPIPDIRPRQGRADEAATLVADVHERAITSLIDDNRLDNEVEATAQDAFMTGRGVTRVRFDADVQTIVAEDPETGQEIEEVGTRVTNETVIYENVSWRDYREGPAKRWDDVPWIAYRHSVSSQEIEKLTDPKMRDAQRDEKTKAEKDEKDADIWEIWCKETRRVYFVFADKVEVINIKDDPLELPGFFPQPAPVQPLGATGRRIPLCPYSVYKKLAEELDRTTKRINAITKGLKVKGAIGAAAQDIEALALAGDNELVAIENVEGLVSVGGLEKAIVWWPIDKAIMVLRELYMAREQTKQSIYEITGVSDIIRGQGAASESATAQKIKTEWGSLRIKKMQRMIERHARDLFVITAEIIARKFTPETLVKMTGIQEAAIAIEAGILDQYRIDIESNSTVRSDTSQRREEMARFLEGTAQFFQVMAPLAAQAPASAAPIAEIYSAFVGQFNLGKQAEDSISQLVEMARAQARQPQQGAENPEAGLKVKELEMKGQESQGKMALEGQKLKLEAAKLELEREKIALESRKLDIDERRLAVDALPRQEAA